MDKVVKYADVVEVAELLSVEDVNIRLRDGWILIDTYKSDYGDPRTVDQTMHYVLGRLPKPAVRNYDNED